MKLEQADSAFRDCMTKAKCPHNCRVIKKLIEQGQLGKEMPYSVIANGS